MVFLGFDDVGELYIGLSLELVLVEGFVLGLAGAAELVLGRLDGFEAALGLLDGRELGLDELGRLDGFEEELGRLDGRLELDELGLLDGLELLPGRLDGAEITLFIDSVKDKTTIRTFFNTSFSFGRRLYCFQNLCKAHYYIIIMPIRRPDGTPLELTKPNPLVASQELWDFANETIYLHNFKKPIAIVIQEKQAAPQPAPRILTKELKEEKPKSVQPTRKKVLVHCLKAVREEHIDELYGDKYYTISYEGKFTFEAVLIGVDDLSISLWAPTENVTESSIIFPEGDRKWWKINSAKPSENGFLLEGTPSIDHPDFSD